MVDERRTLLIEARVNDFATKSFVGMGRAVKTFAATGIDSMRSFGRFVTDTRNIVAGLFAFLAVRRAFNFVDQLAAGLEGISEQSDKIGATTRSLQQLKFVAELNGVSFENLASTGLATLIRNLDEARTGSEQYARAAETLGLSLRSLPLGGDGKVDVIALLAQLADQSKLVTDRFQAQAAAQTLFGRSGREIGAILALTGEEIRKLGAEAERRGIVFSDQDLRRAGDFNDALTRFQSTLKGVSQAIFVDAAPALTAFVTTIGDFVAKNRDAIKNALEDVGRFILKVVETGLQGIVKLVAALEAVGFDFNSDEIDRVQAQIDRLQQSLKDVAGGGGILNPITGERIEADAELIRKTREEISRLGAELERLRSAPGVASQLEAQLESLRKLKVEFAEIQPPKLPDVRAPTVARQFETDPPGPEAATRLLEIERQLLRIQPQTRTVRLRLEEIDAALSAGKLVDDLEKAGLSADEFGSKSRAAFNVLQADLEKTRRLLEGDFFLGFSEQLQLVIDQWTDMSRVGIDAANTIVSGGLDAVTTALSDVISRTKSWADAMRAAGQVIIRALSDVIARLIVVKTLQTFLGGLFGGFGGGGGTASAAQSAGFTPAASAGPLFERGGVFPAALVRRVPLLGFEKGGVIAGDLLRHVPIKAYEAGGIARSPQLAIFGEGKASKGEAFVPLPDGRSIPVTLRGGGGGAPSPQITFEIHAMDAQNVKQALVRERHIIGAIIQHAIGHHTSMRHKVKGAAQ